jgi:hypothetical protein
MLFSTAMVEAILAGRKTQTRRTATNIPEDAVKVWHDLKEGWVCQNEDGECLYDAKVKPKCVVGDVLWVREAHRITYLPFLDGGVFRIECEKPGASVDIPIWKFSLVQIDKLKKSPSLGIEGSRNHHFPDRAAKLRPSIHMPKSAARIWLRCTGVRAERVRHISEKDAKAEGVANAHTFIGIGVDDNMANRYAFRELWQSINGHESWNANPWVWVYKFEVLSTTGKPANI